MITVTRKLWLCPLIVFVTACGGGGGGSGTAPSAARPPVTPAIQISITDSSVAEGDTGTTVMEFSVSLNNATDSTVSVSYTTADGTATAGDDYLAANGTLSFLSGETQQIVEVTIIGDIEYSDNDTDEYFVLSLSNPSGASLGPSNSAIGSILNDDLSKREAYDGLVVLYNDEFLEQILFPSQLPGSSAIDRLANIDLDGDNDLDVIAGSMLGDNEAEGRREFGEIYLFRNNLGKGFTRENTGITGFARDIEVADFNGDGLEDVYFTEHGFDVPPLTPGNTDFLFFQTRTGGIEDVTSTHLPPISDFAHGSCVGDLDLNGAPDVLTVSGGTLPKLMMNDGTGVFSDFAMTNLPLNVISMTYIGQNGSWGDLTEAEIAKYQTLAFHWCEMLDADLDGDLDIILGGWATAGAIDPEGNDVSNTHFLLFNDGAANFSYDSETSLIQATPVSPVTLDPAVTAMVVGDFNRDGCDDFMAATQNYVDHQDTNFFVNDCSGKFTLVFTDTETNGPGLSADYTSIEDIDNDGIPEFVLNTVEGNARLFETNNGVISARAIEDDEIYNLTPATFLQRARTLITQDRWPLP